MPGDDERERRRSARGDACPRSTACPASSTASSSGSARRAGRRARRAAPRVAARAGRRPAACCLLKQVHGCARAAGALGGPPGGGRVGRDGAGLLLGIETADCLPVLLVDPAPPRGGGRPRRLARHRGGRRRARRSTALVARRLAPARPRGRARARHRRLLLRGRRGAARRRSARRRAFFRPGPRGRPHLDVRAANRRAARGGRPAPRPHPHVDDCTLCRADLYHSYRRDGKGAGRMINFVGFARRSGNGSREREARRARMNAGFVRGLRASCLCGASRRASRASRPSRPAPGWPGGRRPCSARGARGTTLASLEAAQERAGLAVQRDHVRVLHLVLPADLPHHQLGVGEDAHAGARRARSA